MVKITIIRTWDILSDTNNGTSEAKWVYLKSEGAGNYPVPVRLGQIFGLGPLGEISVGLEKLFFEMLYFITTL